jgi:hypothetical protein
MRWWNPAQSIGSTFNQRRRMSSDGETLAMLVEAGDPTWCMTGEIAPLWSEKNLKIARLHDATRCRHRVVHAIRRLFIISTVGCVPLGH